MTAAGGLRLYLDEDVDILLGRLLAVHGHDILTAVDAGRLGQSDEDHLLFAAAEGRILITHNRLDFERLAVAWWNQGRDHAGIILAVRRRAYLRSGAPHPERPGTVRPGRLAKYRSLRLRQSGRWVCPCSSRLPPIILPGEAPAPPGGSLFSNS